MSNEYARMVIANLREEVAQKDKQIEELLEQIQDLVEQLEKPRQAPDFLSQALNEGDGSYKA